MVFFLEQEGSNPSGSTFALYGLVVTTAANE